MKDVIQKTLTAGTETEFEMELERAEFLVKNFTDDQITVRLGDNKKGIRHWCWLMGKMF